MNRQLHQALWIGGDDERRTAMQQRRVVDIEAIAEQFGVLADYANYMRL